MAEWLPADTAPKDRMILVDAGWPWAAVAIWSEYQAAWMVAEPQWSVYGGKSDPCFVNEREVRIKRWMELPGVRRGV